METYIGKEIELLTTTTHRICNGEHLSRFILPLTLSVY